jgi:tRNA pseudouridine13 synthase
VVVEVLKESPGRTGDYGVYQATKRWLTTPALQQRLARQLGVPPGALSFPALKDRAALTTQHFTLRGAAAGPLSGSGYTVRMVGRRSRPLSPGDLRGNRFTVALPIHDSGRAALEQRLAALAREGLPNYFDQQRFGSYSPGGVFMGKAILQGDAQAAVRAYLTQPAPGDAPALRAFKAFAGDHWQDWNAMFQQAPRSNHRSLLTFLRDHPQEFRKALNLITPRVLPLLLAAYQSFLWNRLASRRLAARLSGTGAHLSRVVIAGDELILYQGIPPEAVEELRGLNLPLLHHRASFPDGQTQDVIRQVLEGEGLALEDMKARLLKRAYLPRGNRPAVVFPQETAWEAMAGGSGGDRVLRLKFFLPPGSYGTLVLKALGTGDSASAGPEDMAGDIPDQ